MNWHVVLFRVAGVLAVLGAADAFRYPLPSSSTLGSSSSSKNLLSKLGSTTTAAESEAVTTREETKEKNEDQIDWNKQVLSQEYPGVR